jgi:threonine synthase
MTTRHITSLRCVKCHKIYTLEQEYICSNCGLDGILDIEYDYGLAAKTLTKEALTNREFNHWRYLELLPIAEDAVIPHLQVGWTPVYNSPKIAATLNMDVTLLHLLRIELARLEW